jgi:hypothetical protein
MNHNHGGRQSRPAYDGQVWPQQLSGFEAQLAALRPREDRLDRERLMFLAGQASVMEADQSLSVSRRWAWAASLGAIATAAAALLVLAWRPNAELQNFERRPSHERDGMWAVQLESSPSSSEDLILKAGMRPPQVEQVTAAPWRIADNASDLKSDDKTSVLSIHPLDDLL